MLDAGQAIVTARCARDVGLGERLAWLSVGDRAMDLGFSSVGDYAREMLGLDALAAVRDEAGE